MNFLGHAYLSFKNPRILAGNMVTDFIKGAQKNTLPKDVRQGIALHHDIDSFTDSHPAIKNAKQIFRPVYRLYSGAIIDVLMDHYLASDRRIWTEQELEQFSFETYEALDEQAHILPLRFTQVFVYMKAENWLYNYRLRSGMQKSLNGLIRRAAYLSDSAPAFRLFEQHYEELSLFYNDFIGDVKLYANQRFQELAG